MVYANDDGAALYHVTLRAEGKHEELHRYHFPYEYHEETLPVEREGWRACALFNTDREHAKLLIYHESDPVIETAPDFGCAQWCPQEAP